MRAVKAIQSTAEVIEMNEAQDKMFHIKYGDKEYLVMTVKMWSNIFLKDPAKAGEFLEAIGRQIIVHHDKLYAVLQAMVRDQEGKREESIIGGA